VSDTLTELRLESWQLLISAPFLKSLYSNTQAPFNVCIPRVLDLKVSQQTCNLSAYLHSEDNCWAAGLCVLALPVAPAAHWASPKLLKLQFNSSC
jgi:hypothetical protein